MPKHEINISLLKFLSILTTVTITAVTGTAGFLNYLIINKDRDKIADLSQQILVSNNSYKQCENQLSLMDEHCNDKCDRLLKDALENFEKVKSTLERQIEDDISKKENQISSLKAQLSRNKINDKILQKLNKLSEEKVRLLARYELKMTSLQKINENLAYYETGCIDIDRIPAGLSISNEQRYWDLCNKKKAFQLEVKRQQNIIDQIRYGLDSVNVNYQILSNKLNLH